jgi:hypothetical protein
MVSVSAGMWTVQEHLEGGRPVPVELARVISPPTDLLYDPAFPAYHGLAWLQCAPLLLPGATALSTKIPLVAAAGTVHEAGQARRPAITVPSLTAPTPKVPPRQTQSCQWATMIVVMMLATMTMALMTLTGETEGRNFNDYEL